MTEPVPMMHVRRAECGTKVLSAWMHDGKFQKAWKPEMDLFVLPEHRATAEVLSRLEPPVDLDRLLLALHRNDAMKHFKDGVEGIQALIYAPAVVDPWEELQKLRELKALATLRSGLRQCLIGIDSEDFDLDSARGAVAQALTDATNSVRAEAQTVKQMLFDAYREALQPLGDGIMTTGFREIDQLTGGVRTGDTFVFGAETNWGKTAYVILLWHLALKTPGIRPGVVSFEDPKGLYARRLLAMRARINALHLRDHQLRRWEQDNCQVVLETAEDQKCFLDARGRPVEKVAADMRSLAVSEGINFWLVDYLQAIESLKDFGPNRRLHVNHCARQMISVFQQTEGSGYLFSQITKEKGKKVDKDSLRETKDLAMIVTTVMLGLTEQVDKEVNGVPVPFDERKIFVDKVKEGPSKFSVDVEWNSLFAGFEPDLTTTQHQEALEYAQE